MRQLLRRGRCAGALRPGMIYLGAGLFTVAVLIGALYSALGAKLDPGYGAGTYDKAKQEYLAQGLPWTAKELEPRSPIAAAEDATPILQRARREFDSKKWDRDLKGFLPSDADAGAALAPFDASLDRLAEINGKTRLHVSREWDRGPAVVFPEYADWKKMAKALAFRAQVRAERGDRAGAVRDLRATLSFGPLLTQEPTLIGGLVAIACDAIGHDAVRRVAARHPEWSEELGGLVAERGAYDLSAAIRGEAFMGVATARNLDKYGGVRALASGGDSGHDPIPDLKPEEMRRDGDPPGRILRAQAAPLLRYYAEAYRQLHDPKGGLTAAGKRMDLYTEKESESSRASHMLFDMMSPVVSGATAAYDRNVADRRLARMYLELLRAGKPYPGDGWRPRDLDPWGRAYVYKRKGSGFRMYSIGANGKDEGGISSGERSSGSRGDDVAALYPPFPLRLLEKRASSSR